MTRQDEAAVTPRFRTGIFRVCLGALLTSVIASAHADRPVDKSDHDRQNDEITSKQATKLSTISVIAVSPVRGAELPEMMIPYDVQSTTSEDIARSQSLSIMDYMNRNMSGVSINSAANNPLQPDLQFRGFTASSLLGGSEGISVYVDGVRVNEVFGDTINWDLIPEDEISTMSLISGSNPIFGLNTLGGAIQIKTKDGFSDPGFNAQTSAGSFGYSNTTIQDGRNNGRWGYYLLANHFEQTGWRDFSNTNAGNYFGTLSWRGDNATADFHVAHAETKLNGNGAAPIGALDLRPQSVFTAPDRTQNFYSTINGQGNYNFNDATLLTATLFARQVNTRSYNGDAADFDTCDSDPRFLCDSDGIALVDQFGRPVPATFNAINNIGVRKQRSVGGSLQLVMKQPLFGLANQFVTGIDYYHGRLNYSSMLEATTLITFPNLPFSSITAANSGVFVPADALSLTSHSIDEGVYLTDTLSLTDKLALTMSGRYNHTRTTIRDTSGLNPDLNGDHAYHRVNPAVGLTYQWNRAINFYGGYSESTRSPTPVELTCSSPDAPCKLPNEFVADPDLKQVVAKNWEGGLRGTLGPASGPDRTRWKIGLFRTTNSDDIIFQSTGGAQSNEGFYANVGQTRRQGLEASLSGRMFDGRLDWYLNYTYLDARFLTPFTEESANNPTADGNGLIHVTSGDRIPGLPQDAVKLGADYALTTDFSVGGDVVFNSGQYLRGDESNALGKIGGYALVNLRATYHLNSYIKLFASVQNVFDRRYFDFGVVGDASSVLPQFTSPLLLSPGAPRSSWLGISFDL